MNVFVGVLNLTGFTQVFASSLVDLSGGVLALLLVFAMIPSTTDTDRRNYLFRILPRHSRVTHPPLTGGNSASSVSSSTTVAQPSAWKGSLPSTSRRTWS
jgi:hypothetical protein